MQGGDRFDGPQQAIGSGRGIARRVGGHFETRRTGYKGLSAQLARRIIEGEKPLDRGSAYLSPRDRTGAQSRRARSQKFGPDLLEQFVGVQRKHHVWQVHYGWPERLITA